MAEQPSKAKTPKSPRLRALSDEPAYESVASSAQAPGFRLRFFWPVAVGFLLAGFAPEWHAMAAQIGAWAMRFTFPLALLASHRAIVLDAQTAAALPQIAVCAQLPLDGLMMTQAFARGRGLKAAVFEVTAIHALCALVLGLLNLR